MFTCTLFELLAISKEFRNYYSKKYLLLIAQIGVCKSDTNFSSDENNGLQPCQNRTPAAVAYLRACIHTHPPTCPKVCPSELFTCI